MGREVVRRDHGEVVRLGRSCGGIMGTRNVYEVDL